MEWMKRDQMDHLLFGQRERESIDLSNTHLYERETMLQKMERQVQMAEKTAQIAIISGCAGTGKTSLVNALKKEVAQNGHTVLFVRAGYDWTRQNVPYSGIASLCADICRKILVSQPKGKKKGKCQGEAQKQLKKLLGADVLHLRRLVPCIGEILNVQSDDNMTNRNGRPVRKIPVQLTRSLLLLVKALSRFGCPIICLDNLQWIDEASIRLLDYFFGRLEGTNLMFIGLHRSECEGNNRLSSLLRMITSHKDSNDSIFLEEYAVQNLSRRGLTSMIAAALACETLSVEGLAEIIFQLSEGNPRFLRCYLYHLNRKRLLLHSPILKRWIWDVKQIRAESTIYRSFEDFCELSLRNLSVSSLQLLPIVSLFGTKFKRKELDLILSHFAKAIMGGKNDQKVMSTIDTLLSECQLNDIFLCLKGGSFAWGHEVVREKAFNLVNSQTRKLICFQLGELLLVRSTRTNFPLFDIANLMCGLSWSIQSMERRQRAAKLLFEAGEMASSFGALQLSKTYLEDGLLYLPPSDPWPTLTLEYYSCLANVEYLVGDYDKAREFCEAVLNQSTIPLLKKRRAYMILFRLRIATVERGAGL